MPPPLHHLTRRLQRQKMATNVRKHVSVASAPYLPPPSIRNPGIVPTSMPVAWRWIHIQLPPSHYTEPLWPVRHIQSKPLHRRHAYVINGANLDAHNYLHFKFSNQTITYLPILLPHPWYVIADSNIIILMLLQVFGQAPPDTLQPFYRGVGWAIVFSSICEQFEILFITFERPDFDLSEPFLDV